MITPGITTLIFDLGGVILNLSTQKTVEDFARLANKPLADVSARLLESRQFHDYEKGLVSDHDFRKGIRELLNINATDDEVDACWNAMLLDIPPARLTLLENLKKKYQLFLLSNTNEIHLTRFTQIVREVCDKDALDDFFEMAYYSHRLKMRKPDKEIYDFVLSQNNLDPASTLFLDDNLMNLEGAQRSGIQTFHVENPQQLFTLFS